MRRALEESGKPTSQKVSMPAPTRGWNARDPLASMHKADAIYLDNWFPQTTDVMLRKGWEEFATIPTDSVAVPYNIRTLMSYAAPTGADLLFACANTGIYAITAGGYVAAPASVLTNGAVEYINMTTSGGAFLWACNGVDNSRIFNGTTWTELTGVSTPALTGITTTDVTNCSIFKNRIILCKKDSLSFYYLPLSAIAGAAAEFPLGSLFNLGGSLVATANWTLDAGEGADDYFVAITSKGEIAVYKGTDPSDAASFALVGIYYLGAPVGKRCFVKLGGDLCVLTVGGVFPLSKALISANVNSGGAVTDRIVKAWTAATAAHKATFGWQGVVFPEASMLLLNVPIGFDAALNVAYSYQFVMNTVTGAWARFTNQSSECWCVHKGELFFAAHHRVRKAWTGGVDGGAVIDARVKSAFNRLTNGATKRVTLVRPLMEGTNDVELQLGIDMDYVNEDTPGSATSYLATVSLWDSAIWDLVTWVGSVAILKWRTVFNRPGGTVSLRLRLSARNVSLTWSATDFMVEDAGLL